MKNNGFNNALGIGSPYDVRDYASLLARQDGKNTYLVKGLARTA